MSQLEEYGGREMKYRYVFFDADNTLFDYDRAEHKALSSTLRHFSLPEESELFELYRRINRGVWKDFEAGLITSLQLRPLRFRKFFEHLGIPQDPDEASAFYLSRLGEGSDLLDDALDVIRVIATACDCCIVTNGLQDVQTSRLSRSPLNAYLKGMLISETVGSQKPEAGIFEAAMELVGNPGKRDVLMVGDNLHSDILGGIRFGIDTCWFNPASRERSDDIAPSWEINNLRELLPIIGVE